MVTESIYDRLEKIPRMKNSKWLSPLRIAFFRFEKIGDHQFEWNIDKNLCVIIKLLINIFLPFVFSINDNPVRFSTSGNPTGFVYLNHFLPFDPFFWLFLLSAMVGVLELLRSDRFLFSGGSSAPFFFFFIAPIVIYWGWWYQMLKVLRSCKILILLIKTSVVKTSNSNTLVHLVPEFRSILEYWSRKIFLWYRPPQSLEASVVLM